MLNFIFRGGQKKKNLNLLFDDDWLRPMSANERIIGNLVFLLYSCWWRWRLSKASLTLSRDSAGKALALTMCSQAKSAIKSKLLASMSSITEPFNSRLLNSNNECNDKVATCGFDQRLPPSSTSSSNLIHLAVSFHSISSPSLTKVKYSEKRGCETWVSSSASSPKMNCTRWAGGVTGEEEMKKKVS